MNPAPSLNSTATPRTLNVRAIATIALLLTAVFAQACDTCKKDRQRLRASPDFKIESASVTYVKAYASFIFEQKVAGVAGRTMPKPKGSVDGAPVMGYVFPTTLKSQDVGFSPTAGIVALAVTSHPDFDDTPVWDENGNGRYDDGIIYHDPLGRPRQRRPRPGRTFGEGHQEGRRGGASAHLAEDAHVYGFARLHDRPERGHPSSDRPEKPDRRKAGL